MKKKAILAIFIFLRGHAFAQTNFYTALSIPDSLKKDADLVIREEQIRLAIKNSSTAMYEVHRVITVLNEQGSNALFFKQFSDKFHRLEDARIVIYDALGSKTKTYEQKEMTSLNYGDGLVPEGKMTYLNAIAASYPVTIEISYAVRFRGIFSLPGYSFQPARHSVEHSVFDVDVPAGEGLRYKLVHTNRQPVITTEAGKVNYHWEVKSLTAYPYEKHSGSPYDHEPAVFIGPNKFRLEDYEGDMSTWKNFGLWYNNLYAGTAGLSGEKNAFYRELVNGASTGLQKAYILYRYMQTHMRYVSIQLGIGGLKPFPADFVEEKKYGDCKALSNYFRSALNAVGVRSNIVIIEGGLIPRKVYDDFPAHYFNHAILCIPGVTDSTWLECTSTTLPFGILGPFTENRRALMLTDSGGVLVNTPASLSRNNRESFKTNIEVNDDGSAKVTVTYSAQGEQRDELLMGFHDLKDDEKRKAFITIKEWKQPDLADLVNAANTADPYFINAKMVYDKIYSFKAGNKYFFEPRLHPVFDADITEADQRMSDYYFDYPSQLSDTTIYHFPLGYVPESIPKQKSLEQPFAAYTASCIWDAASGTLTTIALLEVKERLVKRSEYFKLLDFKKQVMGDRNEKIVMKKG